MRRTRQVAEDRQAARALRYAVIGEPLNGRLEIVHHQFTAVRLTPATMQTVLAALDEAAGHRRDLAAEHDCAGPASCEECESRLDGAYDFDHAASVLREAGTGS